MTLDVNVSLIVTARYLLATVFLWAGIQKLASGTTDLRHSVQALVHQNAPTWLMGLIAKLLPLVELCVAIALVAFDGIGPLLASTILLGVFGLVVYRAWRSDISVACSCFGTNPDQAIDGVTALRTGSLFGSSLVGLLLRTFVVSEAGFRDSSQRLMSAIASILLLVAGAVLLATARLRTSVDRTIRESVGR